VQGDSGKRTFGTDYYQNTIIWAVPAAAQNQDLKTYCSDGGLIDRMIKAGKPALSITS
jgi:hypothetical protein